METLMILVSQVSLTACPVNPDLQDSDWSFIVYEFTMNYSIDSLRQAYREYLKKENEKVNNEMLRKLGYSEESISKRKN